MPVTAKLSREFYDHFGNDLTNELVDWFNAVDSTYRFDLKELNESNALRFEARLEGAVAALEAKIEMTAAALEARSEARFSGFEARVGQMEARFGQMETRFGQMETRFGQMETRFGQIEARFGGLEKRVDSVTTHEDLARFETRITRWMFGLWTGTMLGFASLLVAVLRK